MDRSVSLILAAHANHQMRRVTGTELTLSDWEAAAGSL